MATKSELKVKKNTNPKRDEDASRGNNDIRRNCGQVDGKDQKKLFQANDNRKQKRMEVEKNMPKLLKGNETW